MMTRLTKGVTTHECLLTPEADEQEIGAQLTLEILAGRLEGLTEKAQPSAGTRAYYERIAHRMKEAEREARHAAERRIAYVEQELERTARQHRRAEQRNDEWLVRGLSANGRPADPLLAHLDQQLDTASSAAKHEGGALYARWQRALAAVTHRAMDT